MWPFGKSTEKRLEEALKDQESTASLDLNVDIKKKTAVVSGEVPDETYKTIITTIAQGINGVENVDLSGVTVAASATKSSSETGTAQTATAQTATTPTGTPPLTPAQTSTRQEDPSAKAKAALANIKGESSLADNPLDVLQKGTTIVLRGAVDSQQEFDKAKALADSVEGVTSVDTSGLQIIQNASQLNVTDDDGDIVYMVKSGDTLSHIALNYYGDAGKSSYMKIAEANGIADANKIQVGQKLKIPGTIQGPEAQLA